MAGRCHVPTLGCNWRTFCGDWPTDPACRFLQWHQSCNCIVFTKTLLFSKRMLPYLQQLMLLCIGLLPIFVGDQHPETCGFFCFQFITLFKAKGSADIFDNKITSLLRFCDYDATTCSNELEFSRLVWTVETNYFSKIILALTFLIKLEYVGLIIINFIERSWCSQNDCNKHYLSYHT